MRENEGWLEAGIFKFEYPGAGSVSGRKCAKVNRQEIFRRELGENHERIEGAVWKLGLAAAVFYRRPVAILTRPINKKNPRRPPSPSRRQTERQPKKKRRRSSILVRHLNEGCFKRGDGVEGWRDEERLNPSPDVRNKGGGPPPSAPFLPVRSVFGASWLLPAHETVVRAFVGQIISIFSSS
ncbi:hypothetical protein GWI33_009600 [Rhynchophorus ferrugineus]|uniref:Uncharacterized protein n=1 Tax=Rhynchophorus ferrugineus TaxID=354439 RepID=A0A834IMY2_RHYFE|nr:hypothetical protein GWI33_009600 [Rhynchophorus ferrugineus]